jgi:hypothetical protein
MRNSRCLIAAVDGAYAGQLDADRHTVHEGRPRRGDRTRILWGRPSAPLASGACTTPSRRMQSRRHLEARNEVFGRAPHQSCAIDPRAASEHGSSTKCAASSAARNTVRATNTTSNADVHVRLGAAVRHRVSARPSVAVVFGRVVVCLRKHGLSDQLAHSVCHSFGQPV